jgi:hypothetical protein
VEPIGEAINGLGDQGLDRARTGTSELIKIASHEGVFSPNYGDDLPVSAILGGGRRAGRGCGTQGRSPRFSFALSTVIPSVSSHSATAPRRHESIRSMTD